MDKKFDIIIYGATGFTGQLCVKYLSKNANDISWAIAGRNKDKLENLKSELSLDVDIFIANSDDHEALEEITKNTKAIALVHYLCLLEEDSKDYFWTRLDLEQFLCQISLIRLKN